MTLIIGSQGSMGKRYQAILKYLDEPFACFDLKLDHEVRLDKFDRFIVATPTLTHLSVIKKIDHFKKPILCEKPLSTSLEETKEILACVSPLSIMMQYIQLTDIHDFGVSSYNYYHHGGDGLIWDCFQVIALAKGRVDVAETSPIWKCRLNGRRLLKDDMDGAYVEALRSWLKGATLERKNILTWHKKVHSFERDFGKWNSGKSV